jgi:hypothetical protein
MPKTTKLDTQAKKRAEIVAMIDPFATVAANWYLKTFFA